MRTIRIRDKNAWQWLAAMQDAGIEAEYLGAGSAHSGLDGGCLDPECCAQHPGVVAHPEAWGRLRVACSGNAAHSLWAAWEMRREAYLAWVRVVEGPEPEGENPLRLLATAAAVEYSRLTAKIREERS